MKHCDIRMRAVPALLAICIALHAIPSVCIAETRRERELAAELDRLRREMFQTLSEPSGGSGSGPELRDLNAQLADKDEEYESLKGKYAKLVRYYKDLKAKNKELSRNAKKGSSASSSSRRERELQKEVARLRADIFNMADAEPSGNASSRRSSELEKELSDAAESYDELSGKYDKLARQYKKAAKDNKRLLDTGRRKENDSAASSRKERELKAEITALNEQLERLSSNSESVASVSTRENRSLRKKLSGREDAYDTLKDRYSALRGHYKAIEKTNRELERGLLQARNPSDRSSKEKAYVKEISRLRTELFQLSRRTSTASESGSGGVSGKTDAQPTLVSRQYRDLKADYTELRMNYDSVLKANKLLRTQTATSSGSSKADARAKSMAQKISVLKADLAAAQSESETRGLAAVDAGRIEAEHVALADRYNKMENKYRAAAVENKELRGQVVALQATHSRRPARRVSAPPSSARRAPPTKSVGKLPAGPAGQAVKLMQAGKYSEAESILAEAAKANPDDMNLLYLFGTIKVRKGQYADAVKVLKRAISSDYDNGRARIALGGAYLALGDHINARMELEMAVGFEPDMSEGHYGLAQVLLVATPSDPEGARDEYYEALRLGSQPDDTFEKKLSGALAKVSSAQQ